MLHKKLVKSCGVKICIWRKFFLGIYNVMPQLKAFSYQPQQLKPIERISLIVFYLLYALYCQLCPFQKNSFRVPTLEQDSLMQTTLRHTS